MVCIVSITHLCLPLYFDYQSCCVCAFRMSALKNFPRHSFNTTIIQILMDCLYNQFPLFLSLDILYGFTGQMWYLVVSSPELCLPVYFYTDEKWKFK